MSAKSNILRGILFSLVLTISFFFVTQKIYHLPFSYGDDHRILALLHPEKVTDSYKQAFFGNTPDLKGSLDIDLHWGRFRPLSWTYYKLLSIVYGDNTFLYRISNMCVLFFSCFFLFGILFLLQADGISAFLIIAFYVFGRNNEAWWTLDPPSQNIGECFLLAGIYAWLILRKKQKSGVFLVPALSFFLAAIDKESYIFCIPILLLTDYFFFNPSDGLLAKEYRLSLLASIIPFAALLASFLHVKHVYSYPYPESVMGIAIYNAFQFIGAAGFFMAPVLLLAINRDSRQRDSLMKLLLVLGLWAIVQLILLKGIKLDIQHHYLSPWLIYPIILTGIALSEIRKISGKWYVSMLVIYGLATLVFIKNTYGTVSSYSATLQAYYNMMDTVKKDSTAPYVVYLGDDACINDWVEGTRMIMDYNGINKELYFSTTATSVPEWEKDFAAHTRQNAYKHIPLDSLFRPDGKWVILVEDVAKNGIVDDNISFYKKGDSSFAKINGMVKYIPGNYFYFSEPYPGRSIGEMIRGNYNAENFKGFYAMKMNSKK